MGSLVLYIMEWAFALIVLLTIYKAVLSGTTLYRFNRFYLLGATLLSALLPLVHITVSDKTPIMSEMTIQKMEFAQELSGTFMLTALPDVTVTPNSNSAHQPSLWAVVLVCMYAGYVIMLITGWTRGIIRARRFLHGKPRRRISRTVWLVTHSEEFGPYSWMNYIVISDTENGFARRASLRHEFAHIRLLHSVDLVFLLACTIVNPICWFVLQEIKIVHEYEADSEVINRYGIRNSDYQKLLIMRTVGAEAYALASSFNLNIKKRIIMLNKNQTRKRRLTWLLLLIPALGITSVLFARTEKSIGPDNMLNLSTSTVSDGMESVESATPAVGITGKVRVSGKVVDQEGNPLASATLGIIDASGLSTQIIGLSGANGEFSFSAQSGDIVTISKDGYTSNKISVSNADAALTVTLNKTSVPSAQPSADDDEVFMVVEEPPVFPGEVAGLLQYLRRNIKYPAECREDSIQGRIMVSFIVDKEGFIKDAQVVQSVHPLLDAEALRVVEGMPQWTPGKQNGQPVRVQYTIPINFRLDSNPTRSTTPQWIYLYDVKLSAAEHGEELDVSDISSLIMRLANIQESDLGNFNTPEVKRFITEYNAVKKEAQDVSDKMNEEIQAMNDELQKKMADYNRESENLSESMRASYEQELSSLQDKITQKLREMQDKMREWADKTVKEMQPQIKAAWQSVSKNGAYTCFTITDGKPSDQVIVQPSDMEAALNDLFNGRRSTVAIPYSEDVNKTLKSVLTQKYAGKTIFFMN